MLGRVSGTKTAGDDGGAPKRQGLALKATLIGLAAAVLAVVVVVVLVTTSSNHAPGHHSAAPSGPPVPLHVVSVTPTARSSGVAGDSTIAITFSTEVAASGAKPTLSPNVPGTWQAVGKTLTFTPNTPLAPTTKYTLRLPAGTAGLHSSTGGVLARPMSDTFTTAAYSQLRLSELLGQLGYLPLTWKPASGDRITGAPTEVGMVGQENMAYSAPAGSFSWNPGYPAELHAQWAPGRANPLLAGAVMAFKAQHNMLITASLTPKFWHALFLADDSGQLNSVGYTYAIANKGSPETLTIWHDGQVVLHSLANTGIPAAPTVDGTFPVYERFLNTIMSGTNPDGSTYSDPVKFVSYFNGGDAVHYFPRPGYGYPQSLGCVELPYSAAEQAFPYLTYGSLVTVMGNA